MKCQRSPVLSSFVIAVSMLLGVSRGRPWMSAPDLPGPASLLDLKMGTTLHMRSFSEAFKVLTGLDAAPWLHQALTGFEALGDSSLRDFFFSAVVSFPSLALSFERPP